MKLKEQIVYFFSYWVQSKHVLRLQDAMHGLWTQWLGNNYHNDEFKRGGNELNKEYLDAALWKVKSDVKMELETI